MPKVGMCSPRSIFCGTVLSTPVALELPRQCPVAFGSNERLGQRLWPALLYRWWCRSADCVGHDELAIALPVGSPLLAGAEITIDMLLAYKVLLWPPTARTLLSGQSAAVVEDADSGPAASSFELMATLVAAGYCVGVAPRSRITRARGWGIVLRPLVGGPHRLTTEFLRTRQHCPPAVERLAARAQRLATDHPQGLAGWT